MGILKSTRVFTTSQANDINKDKMTYDYFSLLNNLYKQKYIKNQNDDENYLMCFIRKRFDTVFSKKAPDNLKKNFNWFDYLEKYLYTQEEHNNKWASDLLDSLDNEYFLYENEYASAFFFEEFRIETEPEIIRGLEVKEKQADIGFTKSLNFSTSTSSDINITKHYGGSFTINSKKEDFKQNDPQYEYKEARTKLKEYVSILKKQIYQPKHPINIIIQKFSFVFCEYLKQKITFIKEQLENEHFDKTTEEVKKNIKNDVVKHLQSFILAIETSIKLMYCKTLNYEVFKNEKDDIINLITCLIFESGEIYPYIFELYKIVLDKNNILYENKIKSFGNIKPQDLGIQGKFCLNELTVQNFSLKSVNVINSTSGNMISEIFPEEKKANDNVCEYFQPGSVEGTSEKVSNTSEEIQSIHSTNEISPYETAIHYLKKIEKFKSPFEKMLVVANMTQKITECITYFWRNSDKAKSFLEIETEELYVIMTYILIKSDVKNLIIHLQIAEDYTTQTTKQSVVGFYYSNLEAAVSSLLDTQNKEELLERGRLKTINDLNPN